ncbi:phage tail protein [Nocardioides montaniterrae]
MQVGRLGRLIVALAMVVGLSATQVGAASATTLPAPITLHATASNPPVLSWSTVAGAVSYQVQVDNEPGFTSPALDRTTVNTTYVGSDLLSAGDYYWQVRARDADNQYSDWTAGSGFTIAPVAAPTGLSPAGATLTQPDQPVRLQWSPVAGATSYTVEVEVGNDPSFVGAKSYTSQVNALVVPDALQATDYSWHVKVALAPGIESAYSSPATFTVGSIAVPSGLRVVAADGTSTADPTDVQDVVLGWTPVAGARSYDLQVSKDDSFTPSSLVEDRTRLYAARYSPATTYDNSQYFWRVRANDLSGNPTAWSDAAAGAATFRRQWTERPSAVFPDPAVDAVVVSEPLRLEWTPIPHASHYQVQLGSDPNFSPGTFQQCQTAGTTYTPGGFSYNVTSGLASRTIDDQCLATPGAVSYWRVRGLDSPFTSANGNGVQGLWSDTHSFIASTDADRLTGVTPTNGATVDVPVLAWAPVRGAETYTVVVKSGSSTIASVTTHSTSYVPQQASGAPLTAGTYTWSIVAKDPSTSSTPLSLTETRSFTVSGSIPDGTGTPLTATAASASSVTTRAPKLSWTPYPASGSQKITYKIDAGQHGTGTWFDPSDLSLSGNLLGKTLGYPTVTDPSTVFAKPGSYDWQVTAYVDGVATATSDVNTFTIANLAAVPNQRLALTGTAFESGPSCAAAVGASTACSSVPVTPVLDWQPVEGASFYVVYIADDSHFTNRLEHDSAMPATTNTRWAPTFAQLKSALPDSKVGESYFVHIRACSSLKSCGADPTSSTGRASMQFTKTSPQVQLQSPAAGATVTSPVVSLTWQDYLDTNTATKWPSATGAASAYQSAKQYRVQVDDDPSFGSPIEDVKVDQATYTSPTRLFPEGTLYWRVQAIDADDNDLSWSARRSFTKATTPPTLLSPLNGSAVGETAVLSWQPQPYAASYDVQLYRGGDTALSTTNKVVDTNVKQAAYVWDKPLPASGSPYVWRVRAVDPSGNNGPWTTVSAPRTTFTVTGAAPTLTSPAAGATVPTGQVVLRWSPVPRATTYQVNVQKHSGSTSIDSASTSATAYAPSSSTLIEPGLVDWRVVAKDSAGNELGNSGWRSVNVSGLSAHLTATTSPRLTGTPAVGSPLNVSTGTWSTASPWLSYQWFRDGVAITNATGSQYLLPLADASHRISVRVTAKKAGWGDGTWTSGSVLIARAPSTTNLLAGLATIKQGTRDTLYVSISVPSGVTTPTGRFRILDKLGTHAAKVRTTLTLTTAMGGHRTVNLKLYGIGLHRLRVTYLGTSTVAGSSSEWAKVRTTR